MLLRRITKHVKDQNWFAVVIDFLIVVVGVFIGIQVSNWNENRAFEAKEREYLTQLKGEVAFNVLTVEHQTRFMETVVQTGKRALTFLESDKPCTEKCADLLIDFFHASQVWGTPLRESTFLEMERLGLPSDKETREQVSEFYLQMRGYDIVTLTPPKYRETVRGHFSPDAAQLMWQSCHILLYGTLEIQLRDCLNKLETLDTATMIEGIRTSPGVEEQLRFWIGQNAFAFDQYKRLYATAQKAMTAVETDLNSQ